MCSDGERSFPRAVRTTHDPQSRSFHEVGGLGTARGGLQRILFCFRKGSHKLRSEFRRRGVNRLLAIGEKAHEVQRFLLQFRRQRLSLLIDLFGPAPYIKRSMQREYAARLAIFIFILAAGLGNVTGVLSAQPGATSVLTELSPSEKATSSRHGARTWVTK